MFSVRFEQNICFLNQETQCDFHRVYELEGMIYSIYILFIDFYCVFKYILFGLLFYKYIFKMQALLMKEFSSAVFQQMLENPYKTSQFATQWAQGTIDGVESLLTGSWDLAGRTRSLQLTVVNATKSPLLMDENFFKSGTWYQSWNPRIEKQSITTGFIANKQGSIMTGVTGGLKFQILNEQALYLMIGFTNPYVGSYKFNALFGGAGSYAKQAYKASHNNHPKHVKHGKYLCQIAQVQSQYAQMGFVYTLTDF